MDDLARLDRRVLAASRFRRIPLVAQVSAFVGVGLIATAVHYAVLIALVQLGHAPVVPATLVGFTAGGIVSYRLNRKHTFASDRPHREAVWRFLAVSAVAFALTFLLMQVMVVRMGLPYLPAQVVTTGSVMVWNFCANKLWTFAPVR